MKSISTIMVSLFILISSCKKDTMTSYQGGPGLYFYTRELLDSMSFSFAYEGKGKKTDTLGIEMLLMGDLVDYDRDVELEAIEGTTAKADVHYKLPVFKLKKNVNNFNYRVIIYNTEDLKTNSVRIVLQVKKNKDFPEGGALVKSKYQRVSYKVDFNNNLIKPSYWKEVEYTYGKYSEVKYRFMVETTGYTNFLVYFTDGGTLSASEFLNVKGRLINALEAYEKENGPLIDEYGEVVSFPQPTIT